LIAKFFIVNFPSTFKVFKVKSTLRKKFILLSTVLVTIIMITITYLFTIREINSKRTAVESQMRRIAEGIATMQLLDRQDWAVYQNYISQLVSLNRDIVYIAIYDDRNLLRSHALNSDLIEGQMPSYQSSRITARIVKQLDSGEIAKESQPDLNTQRVNIQAGERVLGSVHVGFSLIQINDQLQNSIRLNIGLAVFFFIVFTTAAVFVSGKLTAPLERLSAAMTAVAAGNLEQKIKIETSDEIGELAQNFNQMVEGLKERNIIEKLGSELGAKFILTDLANLVREQIGAAIGASAARLYIRNRDQSNTYYEITVAGDGPDHFPALLISLKIKDFLRQQVNGFMVRSTPEYIHHALRYRPEDRDGLVVPLIVKEDLLGLLFFTLPENQSSFDPKQQHFAVLLASQGVLALENALLYEDQREKERLQRELEIAREVQQKLLPARMPEISGFQIDGFCRSAQEVGGDYFDFFDLGDNRWGIVIADVSGKGTSASFYMAEIKGMMLQLTGRQHSPAELLGQLNHYLHLNVDRHLFVSMIYGILDGSAQKITFARAGHNSLLYINSANTYQFLTPSGIGLGLDPGKLFQQKIEEVILPLSPGDTLVFFTDGVVEAMNRSYEEFGEERMVEVLLTHAQKNCLVQRKELMVSLEKFMDGQPQNDDITTIIIRCEV